MAVVHDQCSNVQLAGEILYEESVRVLIVWHIVCNYVLRLAAISQPIGVAKKLVAHFRHSALATNELRKCQDVMGITL